MFDHREGHMCIGENNTGKSCFMQALRLCLDVDFLAIRFHLVQVGVAEERANDLPRHEIPKYEFVAVERAP